MIFYSKLIGKCGLDLVKKHTVVFHEICFIRQLQKRMENCPMKSIFDHNFSEKEMTDMNFAIYPEHGICSSSQTQDVLVTKLAGISSMLLKLARFHSLASVTKRQGYIRLGIQTHSNPCQ